MDWPMSSAEKRGLAFALYHREVAVTEASLQAAEREIRELRREQVAPSRWSISSGSETQETPGDGHSTCRQEPAQSHPAPAFPLTPRRRRWSRRSAHAEPAAANGAVAAEPWRPQEAPARDPEVRLRAVSWDTGGNQRRERRVPLVSLEQFLGQDVPNCPFGN